MWVQNSRTLSTFDSVIVAASTMIMTVVGGVWTVRVK